MKIRSAKTEGKVNLRWPIESLKVRGSGDSLKALQNAVKDVIGAGSVNPDGIELIEGEPTDGDRFAVEAQLAKEEAKA